MKIFGTIRISVLTSRLLRVESSPEGIFCDAPTQGVLHRDLGIVAHQISEPLRNADGSEEVLVTTPDVTFTICVKGPKAGAVTRVGFSDGSATTEFHKGNLKGTYRTLDMANGAVKLGEGVVSRNGCAVLDDHQSVIMTGPETFEARPEGITDYYYFAYGHDYAAAVADYCRLTGDSPLIPRYVLGNWWSRYYAYTQQEYLDLMDQFVRRRIPITVATVDMDWHWVNVREKFKKGTGKTYPPDTLKTGMTYAFLPEGWTGYSWNTDLFPDYRAFLKELHEKGLQVTLNLHPADGVRFYEDQYEEFAKFMGISPATRKPIKFDLADPKFREGYFRFLHHPYEQEGVDFWWIDWQQGTRPNADGLDNLWALNHFHCLDMERRGKRPLILSRFAGTGSQRYPLGFSGDTIISWKSLDFQVTFTATASNIGFPWWSHDIGGHQMGERNDELYLRWVQYAVFSPILRLHSSANPFMGKEPWNYNETAEAGAVAAMRLRHRLIPYLYTANWKTHQDHLPLVTPMYWHYPEAEEAYEVPNEYFFGSELLCAPITRPEVSKLHLAWSEVWLPEGRWTDIFNGRIYNVGRGGQRLKLFRNLKSIPVLAKAGAIIPMSGDTLTEDGRCNSWQNPETLELLLYRGNGSYTLYEDDGVSLDYQSGDYATTTFTLKEEGTTLTASMEAVKGKHAVLPETRTVQFHFADVSSAEEARITRFPGDEKSASISGTVELERAEHGVLVTVPAIRPDERVEVLLTGVKPTENPPERDLLVKLFAECQGSNNTKAVLYIKALEPNFPLNAIGNSLLRDAVREIRALR